MPVLTRPGVLISNYICLPSILLPNVCQFHQQSPTFTRNPIKTFLLSCLYSVDLAFLKHYYRACLDLKIVLVLQRSLILFNFFRNSFNIKNRHSTQRFLISAFLHPSYFRLLTNKRLHNARRVGIRYQVLLHLLQFIATILFTLECWLPKRNFIPLPFFLSSFFFFFLHGMDGFVRNEYNVHCWLACYILL